MKPKVDLERVFGLRTDPNTLLEKLDNMARNFNEKRAPELTEKLDSRLKEIVSGLKGE